jgi:hypothetical protein
MKDKIITRNLRKFRSSMRDLSPTLLICIYTVSSEEIDCQGNSE